MKRIFYTSAVILLVVSACKKNDNSDFAKTLLVGTWNHVDIKTKIPTGKHLKLTGSGEMESDVITGYNAYELKNNELIFKGVSGTLTNSFTVSSDSLYVEPKTPCADVNGCATLYARQK